MPESRSPNPALHESGFYHRPLIPLLMALMAGTCCANQLPESSPILIWLAGVGTMATAGVLIFQVIRGLPAKLSPLVFFFFLGYAAMASWLAASPLQKQFTTLADGHTPWIISGRITGPLNDQGFRTVCFLDHLVLSRTDSQHPDDQGFAAKDKIRLAVYGKAKDIKPGTRITFTAKIRPFRNFKNPGAFDYVKYMRFQGTWGNAYVSAKNITSGHPVEPGFQFSLANIRGKIAAYIDRVAAGDANSILHALILGNRSKISSDLRDAFNRAGISHLLAISGLHIGIVAVFSFFIFSRILSQFSLLLRHAWTRKGAAILSLWPVLAYGTLAGMSPSTQRAVVMAAVFLMTFIVLREHNLINTISVAALVILVIHPPSLFSISFQLSFAAVLSIVFGMMRFNGLREKKSSPPQKTGRTLWVSALTATGTFVLVSGLAILGTTPLTMHYFNQISFVGLLSNLIFIPVIGFFAVPMGLFSVLALLPIWPAAAGWGLSLSASVLTPATSWIYWISSLPWAAAKTVTPSVIEMICFYALFGALLCLFTPRRSPVATPGRTLSGDPDSIKPENKAWHHYCSSQRRALIVLGVFLTVFAADIGYWIHQRWGKKDFTVSFMDVGQGNAALLEMPEGRCALIDGGGYGDNSIFDMGERVVAPFLWRKKIKTVETLFLTHYDADHANGLIYILRHFNVQKVYAPHDMIYNAKNAKFSKAVREAGAAYPLYPQFAKNFEISGVRFTILYPPENFPDLARDDTWRDSNNNSMVIRARFKNHSFLFPGDILKQAEKELVNGNAEISATVMLAPHHGSNSSSTDPLLERINPAVAVISAGFQNRFGFPSPALLERYQKHHITILRTDINGGIRVSTDGTHMTISPYRGEEILVAGQQLENKKSLADALRIMGGRQGF